MIKSNRGTQFKLLVQSSPSTIIITAYDEAESLIENLPSLENQAKKKHYRGEPL
jgi:hypothetical protein